MIRMRNLFFSAAVLLLFLAGSVRLAPAGEPPNIVLIIADDMGYSDLGCYGGEIETPHLDAPAEGGLRFNNFYVNNMCWPTRASLMTGLYPKTALPKKGSAEGGLHPGSITLPEALRGAGYTTLTAGKWHLSNSGEPDGESASHHRGFDHFYGTIEGASDFFAPVDLQLDGSGHGCSFCLRQARCRSHHNIPVSATNVASRANHQLYGTQRRAMTSSL